MCYIELRVRVRCNSDWLRNKKPKNFSFNQTWDNSQNVVPAKIARYTVPPSTLSCSLYHFETLLFNSEIQNFLCSASNLQSTVHNLLINLPDSRLHTAFSQILISPLPYQYSEAPTSSIFQHQTLCLHHHYIHAVCYQRSMHTHYPSVYTLQSRSIKTCKHPFFSNEVKQKETHCLLQSRHMIWIC